MGERLLRVLPDRERVEEELLLNLGASGVALGADLLTFPDFLQLFEALRDDKRVLIEPLAARAVLGQCAAAVDMGPFAPVKGKPGFLKAAQETIASLKSGRCWAETFADAAARFPPERAGRIEALARLYRAYEEALEERGLCDEKDCLAAAVLRVKDATKALPAALLTADVVVFEDLYDFPPLRLELLLALAARLESEGRGQRLRILLPHDTERPELMAFVDPVYEQLYKRATESRTLEIVPKSYGALNAGPPRLARALFRSPPPSWEGEPAATVLSLANPGEEAREIARRVRDLIDEGEPPESIAVAVRRLDDEAHRLAQSLERYGVPARIRRGVKLASVPIASLALTLATLKYDGYPRDSLEAILASGFPALFAPEAGRIIRAIRESGLRGDQDGRGKGGWARALARLADRRRKHRGGDVESALRAVEAMAAIVTAAAEIPEARAPVSTHVKGMVNALKALGALDRVESEAARRATLDSHDALGCLARDQLAARELLKVSERLTRAFETAGRAREVVDPPGFAALLADAFSEPSLPARGPRGGAVRVVEVRELVGRHFEHLFLAGLVDGRFPAAPEPHPLFSDEDKTRLNALVGFQVFRGPTGADGPMPERQAEEPLLFHLALCAAGRQVTLSSARAEDGGREAIHSRFIEEVVRLPGAFLREKGPLAILPLAKDARTRSELIARAALELRSDRSLRASPIDPTVDATSIWGALRARGPARLRSIEGRIDAERERFLFFARPDAPAGRFSGDIGEKAARSLSRHFAFDEQKPLSPRALSEYGNCRFQGFSGQVLRLRGEEEADTAADAATRGDLYHRAMQLFMLDRQREGRLPLRGDDADLEALERALADAAEALAMDRHLGHPALWELTLEEASKMLARVVRSEGREPIFPGLVPWRFEEALGDELPLLQIPGPDGERAVSVGGRIDRIDAAQGQVGIVDYKSSKADGLEKRFRENFLQSEVQLAIYTMAVAQARQANADAAFVSLRDARVVKLSDMLLKMGLARDETLTLDVDQRRQLREKDPEHPNLGDAVWKVVKDAREGHFAVRPLDCRYCEFSSVCRIGSKVQMEDGE